ncbi:MAG: hypothetical protein ACJAYG_001494 [Oceanicoccus sp.]|jgi:hypothetical protein
MVELSFEQINSLLAANPTVSGVKWQQVLTGDVDREILFREALARQWHLNDSVIRRRLILDMEFLEPDNISGVEQLLAEAVAMDLQYNDPVVRQRLLELMKLALSAEGQAQDPEEAVLRSRYNLQRAQLVGPARSHFQHVFISRDRHEDAEGKAAKLLSHLLALDEPEQSAPLSDPFLHGRFFTQLTEGEISGYFGAHFTQQLFYVGLPVQQWVGSIRSIYGLHWVWQYDYTPAVVKSFEAVGAELLAQWRLEQGQLNFARNLAALRKRYQVRA